MTRIAVLVSGSGSNLQALIDACRQGTIAGEIVLVLSNRPDAYALARATQASIATQALALKPWLASGSNRESYDAEVARRVNAAAPDLVVLAGWMHVFGRAFLEACAAPIINLHPALPGTFPGTRAIERALEAYRRGEITQTGCMVHKVIAEVDAGPVLGIEPVEILPGDTLESLSLRMHQAEHALLVAVVARLCEDLP